jgi:hypothetical protein
MKGSGFSMKNSNQCRKRWICHVKLNMQRKIAEMRKRNSTNSTKDVKKTEETEEVRTRHQEYLKKLGEIWDTMEDSLTKQ